jgi:hypothetical protein
MSNAIIPSDHSSQSANLDTDTTLGVCLPQDSSVTCEHCRTNPAKSKGRFCSNACRQAAYRLSPAHRKNLDRQKTRRLDRRNRWVSARLRDKHFTFDGLFGGHININVPCLGDFEKYPAETYIVHALEQILGGSTK